MLRRAIAIMRQKLAVSGFESINAINAGNRALQIFIVAEMRQYGIKRGRFSLIKTKIDSGFSGNGR